jgi:hypothetical protein
MYPAEDDRVFMMIPIRVVLIIPPARRQHLVTTDIYTYLNNTR